MPILIFDKLDTFTFSVYLIVSQKNNLCSNIVTKINTFLVYNIIVVGHVMVSVSRAANVNNTSAPMSVLKKSNFISFKGQDDVFVQRVQSLFGNINDTDLNNISGAVDSQKSINSGFTSGIYKIKDLIVKVPKKREFKDSVSASLAEGQNLKEYYILKEIEKIDPEMTPATVDVIRKNGLYCLVEKWSDGVHPKGNAIGVSHIRDLLSKFIKLDMHGITNSDVQSGNVFLLENGKTKLIDFGSFNFIDNAGRIIGSDYVPHEIFKPGGDMSRITSLPHQTRFLKTFLAENYTDIKNLADNPYLKIQSNATNFEYRTLYTHLLDGSEKKPLDFFRSYLKQKGEVYHTEMKRFLEGLSFDSADFSEFGTDKVNSAKSQLKKAIDYEGLAQEVLKNPADSTVKVELSKIQLRTFLNLGDSLNSPVENSRKLKASYDQLISLLKESIENSEGNTKKYYEKMLGSFEEKFKAYEFAPNQVEIPEGENLVKVLFKQAPDDASSAAAKVSEVQESAAKVINKTKFLNKKTAVLIGAAAAVLAAVVVFLLKKSGKLKAGKIVENPVKNSTKVVSNTAGANSVNAFSSTPDIFSQFSK